MPILLVVDNPNERLFRIPGVDTVAARSYLTDPKYIGMRNVKVFNLCKSYRYQSFGYYVSLLAAARGHKPLPSISTAQDMKSQTIVRFVSEDLEALIQDSLATIRSNRFTLSIYFGHNLAKRYERLSRQLFNLFPAPLLRAEFSHNKKWQLHSLGPIATNEIPADHEAFLHQTAMEHFSARRSAVRKRVIPRFDLAILHNPNARDAPSDARALKRFIRAAARLGIHAELIGRDQYGDIAEYDALFVRETTSVNHHTYRFASRAAAEGLVVIDDPESILKCTNKVYLAELLDRHGIRTPKTKIVYGENVKTVARDLGFPCILKQPDSSFSQGVVKVDNAAELETQARQLLERSELIIAQEFLPTDFDWRVGVINGQPLYVCKYFMARKHWQIIQRHPSGRSLSGDHTSLSIEDCPKKLLSTALRAANLIGDGLYGVDLKQVGKRFFVIEVNDNPSIESGVEDAVLKDELYHRIMRVFLDRMESRKRNWIAL